MVSNWACKGRIVDGMTDRGKNTAVENCLPKRLYSITESARYLGRTACAVREMLWAGKIPFVKDGRRILLDRRDMDHWIDSHKTVNHF